MNKPDETFYCPETDQEYDAEEVKNLDLDVQKSVMRHWFWSNYENPAENTPFESRGGGYLYIWGGPFDAREELEAVFSYHVPREALDELVSELESESLEWSARINSEGYDAYFYTVVHSNHEFTENLKNNLNSIKELLKIDLSPRLEQHMNKMLFANVITALETFLSDAFIGTVLSDRPLLRDFVRLNPDFSNRQFPLNKIFERIDNIEKEVTTYLLGLIWHNLAKVQQMYCSVLHIEFPEDMKPIYRGVAIRHDIVHRNGKTKSGKDVTITRDELMSLMDEVNSLAETIDDHFNV